jgi:putative peptidoglycan lipid II flippase
MSTKKGIAKFAAQVGSATMLSRILGFLRDIIIANRFGTGMVADAFVMAFAIPNLLRDLVGEGASSAAIVPALTLELTKRGKDKFWQAAAVLLNFFLLTLLLIVGIGIVTSPVIVRVIASGFVQNPDKFELTVRFLRLLFPFILFIGLAAYVMGVLNSLKHFLMPSIGPVVFNSVLILCMVFLYVQFGRYALVVGVLLGGLLQLAVQIPILFRSGFRPSFKIDFKHPIVKKVLKLLGPRALGASVYQVNFIVSRSIASWLPTGAAASLYFANRLFQLPLAIFAIAIAQAALPYMSEHAAKNDIKNLKKTFNFSLRHALYITIPASSGLVFLSRPIISTFFQHGAFSAHSTDTTQAALAFYAIGLFAVSGIKITTYCFYSLHDTLTPVKTAFIAFILNVVFSLLLIGPMRVAGLALAATLAVTFNFVFLMLKLRMKIGLLGGRGLVKFLIKVIGASAAMGVLARLIYISLLSVAGTATAFKILVLVVTIAISIVLFFFLSFVFRIEESRGFYKWILGKK